MNLIQRLVPLAILVLAGFGGPPAAAQINFAPDVTITSPQEGETASGTVVINGTASDPDLADSVEFVEVRIDNGTWERANGTDEWTFTWDATFASLGNHTIEARSNDGDEYSGVANRTVNVESPNRAPVVAIHSPARGARVSGIINITGNATDPDGDPVTVQVRVPGVFDWTNATGGLNWTHTWDTRGIGIMNATIQARGSDGELESAIDERQVTVENLEPAPQPGDPPVVEIVEPGEGAVLTGGVEIRGRAFDPDGGNVTVQVRVPGVFNWTAVLGARNWTHTWNVTAVAPGEYRIEARAQDDDRLEATDSVRVVVNATGNRPPTVTITEPIFPRVSGQVRIAGTALDPDPSDQVARVEILIEGVTVWTNATLGSEGEWSFVWNTTRLQSGNYTVRVRATDTFGATGADSRVLVVAAFGSGRANAPPALTVDTPRPGSILNGAVLVSGRATDPDANDTVERVEVRVDSGPWVPAELTNGTFTYALNTSGFPDGMHVLTLRAFDGEEFSTELALQVEILNEGEALEPAEEPLLPEVPAPGLLALLCVAAAAIVLQRRRR